MDESRLHIVLDDLQKRLWETVLGERNTGILPNADQLAKARSSLPDSLPLMGIGLEETARHLLEDVIPGLNGSSVSPNYYGFVTGGVTPAALLADNVVSAYDQNVQVHLPNHSVATDVESSALGLLLDLFGLHREAWKHATFTTGATASNLHGLACGREFALNEAAERKCGKLRSVADYGITDVLTAAGLTGLQVLTTLPHSSLGKAAAILGIGRANVKNICCSDDQPLKFDFQQLERELAMIGVASIVVISCGEVNTGRFATEGIEEFMQIRQVCSKYKAWLHVDGAFGIFGRILRDSPEFNRIRKGCAGLEFADSIAGDAHKLLNVPYDCGFFFCRHANIAQGVFQNTNAAYLSASKTSSSGIPSPNNVGIENSRRFRALPVYASLLAYGRDGYRTMLERQVRLARALAAWLYDHPRYTTLPHSAPKQELLENTFMIVLFKATSDDVNLELEKRINATSEIFVSGTTWEGHPACRIAISNWRADEERDYRIITDVLQTISR